MNVCVISSMYPTKRAPHNGVFITRRLEALKKLGVDVDAFALVREESWASEQIRKLFHKDLKEKFNDEIYTDNDKIIYKAIKVKLGIIGLAINTLSHEKYYAWKAGRTLLQSIKGEYDVIHAHWLYPTGKAAVLFAKKRNIPVIVTCHGSDINRIMQDEKYRNDCKWTLGNATEIEFVSQKLKHTAAELGGKWKIGRILPNGINNYADLNINDNRDLIIGFVGNLIDVKRVDCFPLVFKELHEKYPSIEFIIIGDGDRMSWLRQEMKDLPVTFTGRLPQKEVFSVMRQMKLMILPSRNEGWPCVVLEAHSCGTPVIGSDCGGIPEAIGDNRFIVKDNTNIEMFSRAFTEKIIDFIEGEIAIDSAYLIKRSCKFQWENLQEIEREEYSKYARKVLC